MTTPPPDESTSPGDIPPPPPSYGDMPQGSYQGEGALVGPSNDEDKTMAMLAHLGNVIGGFILPLIIMLVKKESPFVQQESKEALNFSILMMIISMLTCGIGSLISIIFGIMAVLKAKDGIPYRYPFNWRIIK